MVFKTVTIWLYRAKNWLLAPQLAPVQRRYYLRVGWLNGGGGIRTPETGLPRLLVFETSAFIRSATPPGDGP